ncbi:MAG: hypothetical protein COW56_06240 [Rhodocyclales bacterium CG17_big_fil_post_rev_8_21_14_2_50_68_7]|nr:MAG: hypothetical protein AUK49_07985 [Betaproteobacteria bacterium CG2_30_68_42]PIV73721.1 MAG: hypothetical protein COW56_06240 [Rhodocyclales bacterium CG17_big_fil_post_rev_8_21_14_2_50_68_7]PIX75985.1 MAG: hypothetical protein COZ38_02705 [Rhodocyclales bacterium CG_4_10_14_3_um_filter_68_10]PJA57784.1 MAG: hypothetical protein CO164_06170 [Rhodocyclales bacterium CG_4_9_14_3_um_filter_68_10]
MKRSYQILATLAAASSLALAAAVYAQPGGWGGAMPMGPMMGAQGPAGPMMMGGPGKHAAHDPEAHLRELKAELKINAEQEGAWQAFATQANAQAATMKAMFESMRQAAGPAPERMESRVAMMKTRVAGMEAMSAALKDLYAVLTPEQKAIADQRFGHMRGRGYAPRRG